MREDPTDQKSPMKPLKSTLELGKRPFDSCLNILNFVERCSLRINRLTNQLGILGSIGTFWGNAPKRLIQALTSHRWHIRHSERLAQIPDDASILLVANHRTFFDLFIVMTALRIITQNRLGSPCSFPVRSPFFYDNFLGLIINLIFSGGSMYPPIFRDERKKVLNAEGLRAMQMILNIPGACLGLHPEGRRSTLEDPFMIEPLRPGITQLIRYSSDHTYILPVFVSGLTNHIFTELKQTMQRRKASPIYIHWGVPELASTYQGNNEMILSQVSNRLQELANQEKQMQTSS